MSRRLARRFFLSSRGRESTDSCPTSYNGFLGRGRPAIVYEAHLDPASVTLGASESLPQVKERRLPADDSGQGLRRHLPLMPTGATTDDDEAFSMMREPRRRGEWNDHEHSLPESTARVHPAMTSTRCWMSKSLADKERQRDREGRRNSGPYAQSR